MKVAKIIGSPALLEDVLAARAAWRKESRAGCCFFLIMS